MAILLDDSSRVLTQGITGKVGSYHTLRCLNYGMGRDCFVGGVNPKRGGEIYEDMKIFATVAEAKEETDANISVSSFQIIKYLKMTRMENSYSIRDFWTESDIYEETTTKLKKEHLYRALK